jgi:ATP phosphoribosyltransferase regulatory subunit
MIILCRSGFPIIRTYFERLKKKREGTRSFFRPEWSWLETNPLKLMRRSWPLAIAALKAAGVKKFKIALGHVGFLNGLFQGSLGDNKESQALLKEYLINRDYVGFRAKIKELSLPEQVRKELEGILRLRGGEEICVQARSLSADPTAQASIAHLCEVWDVLKAYEVCDHVLIDLTMIGDFSYYTGMTFEGYASDLGFPVCSGGRYDNLIQQFGRAVPATGFALKTNRILELVGQKDAEAPYRVLVLYDGTPDNRRKAIQCAAELRLKDRYMVETMRIGQGQNKIAVDDRGDFEYLGVCYQDIIEFTG